MASRQAEWQKKQVAAGNCGICGRKRGKSKRLCDGCLLKARKIKRLSRIDKQASTS